MNKFLILCISYLSAFTLIYKYNTVWGVVGEVATTTSISIGPATTSIREMYERIPDGRYVIYYETGAGWGNRVMATIKALMYAIESDRRLIIRHKMFQRAFDVPSCTNCDFYNQTISLSTMKSCTESFVAKVVHVPDDCDVVVIPQEGFNHIPVEWATDRNRTSYINEVGSFLMSRPTTSLMKRVEEVKGVTFGVGQPVPDTSVQIRTMIDYAPGHAIAMSPTRQLKIWECVRGLLRIAGSSNGVFFTTDEKMLFGVARHEMSHLAPIHIIEHAFEHTAKTRAKFPMSLIEWYFIGEGSTTICSGTSFCRSAVARRGKTDMLTIGNTYKQADLVCDAK